MSKIDDAELRRRVRAGAIGALTLDTNILRENGYRFQEGMLGELDQFADSDLSLVLSEIVVQETTRHITDDTKAAAANVGAAIAKAKAWGLVASADPFVDQLPEPVSTARRRVQDFIDGSAIVIADAADCDVQDVVRRYFNGSAPFGRQAKKSEFPDAIALSSLDQWAIDQETEILAVSKDEGWQAFCDESTRIHAVDSLARALAILQQRDFPSIVAELVSDDLQTSTGKEAVRAALAGQTHKIDVTVDGSSYFFLEMDVVEVGIDSIEFGDLTAEKLIPVNVSEDEVLLQVECTLLLRVEVSVEFSTYDSFDKEYLAIATQSFVENDEVEASLLLRYAIADDDGSLSVALEEIVLERCRADVWLGELEPDFGQDD